MRSWFPLGIVLLLATGVSFAGTSLDAPVRFTPELAPFIIESLDGRLFLAIDDMLIPVDTGEKSALWGVDPHELRD